MPIKDISGQVFGRLTALRLVESGGKRGARWECRCECGKVVVRRAMLMKNGNSRSCGCLHRERTSQTHTTHGHARGYTTTPEYYTWLAMLARCHTPTHKMFHHYGGRGIVVCDRWRESFANFLADMGPRPGKKHTLERVDNDGPYSPDNCRWATWIDQGRNKRNSRLITFNGRTETARRWGIITGIPPRTVLNRLNAGLPPERILDATGYAPRTDSVG